MTLHTNDLSLSNPDILPDGKKFVFWDCDTAFTRTWYVDKNHPCAEDENNNEGTADHPFKTIKKAAALAQPGERVLIRKGSYYETIRNVNSGTDSAHMILFEGEDGVVITGAVTWDTGFLPSEGYRQTPVEDESELFSSDRDSYFSHTGAKVWMGSLPDDKELYEYGLNPFFSMNLQTMAWIPRKGCCAGIMDSRRNNGQLVLDEHLQRRGMLFMDGKRIRQVVRYFELFEQDDDVFWVDDTYKRIHFHLKNNESPEGHHFEISLLEQGFMPRQAGLGYLYFKNLTFDKFATPVKCPQYGALSSNCGHHFIIENCCFRDINSVGVDLGFISHAHYHEGIRGWHIVRKNHFLRCGIGGMSAVPTQGKYLENMLVERNVLIDNGYHNLALLFESAAIKSHYTHNSLYRFNYVNGMEYGNGIWLDKGNANTRICGNIILNINHADHGGIFNEATLEPVLIDHNIIAHVGYHVNAKGETQGGNGIYEHECENTLVRENIVYDCDSDGIEFKFTPSQNRRFLGENRRVPMSCNNKAENNVLFGCSHGVTLSTSLDYCNRNFIQNSRISECMLMERGEHHNRASLRMLYGFETEESSVKSIELTEDELVLLMKDGKKQNISLTVLPENSWFSCL